MNRLIRNISHFFTNSLDQRSMLMRRNMFYADPNNKKQSLSNNPIQYVFDLILHPGEQYEGLSQVQFTLSNPNKSDTQSQLFLDFQGQSISKILINSHEIQADSVWHKGRIILDQKYLKPGVNHVVVSYLNKYDKDGSGCVSFIDIDKKQYLYTQFQPYMANRVFPLFDQPDLKAKMGLSISCVKQWKQVISNQMQNCQTSNSDIVQFPKAQSLISNFRASIPSSYKTIKFMKTLPLSSYLYCFVVGPYQKLICQNTHRGIPMNLYCIQSLFPYLIKLAPFIQETTNKSMKFFETYFGYRYPFSKYDQVFAHQYKWGAMENAGIVTLNDLYIFKDPVSNEKMLGFGNTIVHELAHHWFGNLVTMKWWDDLWLNESFAEYISHFCQQKIKNQMKTISYQSAMTSFLNRKNWGYAQDQLITTHPIRTEVQNTDVAESIFDGITYSKGAATMKQLMYLMGQQNFSNALKQYFHRYAFKNADLKDLLNMLQNHYPNQSKINLQQWKQMWLEKEGLNILSCQVTKQSKLKIKQQNYHHNHKTLRSHTIKVAIFFSQKQYQELEINIGSNTETLIDLPKQISDNISNYKAILLNHQDLTFAKVLLDKKSQQFFQQNVKYIDNVLLRSMVWKIFSDLVKQAKVKSTDYIDMLVNHTFQEISDTLLEQNLTYASLYIRQYTPKEYRKECFMKMFQACYDQLTKNSKQLTNNRKIILRDKMIAFVEPSQLSNLKIIEKWFKGDQNQDLSTPNITERWKILMTILSSEHYTNQEKQKLLEDMMQIDKSDEMKNKLITCKVLLASQAQLDQIYNSYFNKHDWSMVSLQHSISGFNNHIHGKVIRNKFAENYMKDIKLRLEQKQYMSSPLKNNQLLEIFIEGMDPKIDDRSQDLKWKIDKLSEIKVKSNKKLEIGILKKIDILKKRKSSYQLYEHKK